MNSTIQILIFSFGLLVNLAYAQQIDDKQLTACFDKVLSEEFKSDETGATVLVSRNGQIIYKKAFGLANLELNVPMQVEDVFRIGSITKQFTAVAILQLMEKGVLNLQDEITRFIPDYPTQGNTIRIQHLLTHTSGIANYSGIDDTANRISSDCSPKEMVDYFRNLPMRFATGTKWEYSNSNYYLLGYIIEIITGKTYAEYLEENIFKPLGMINSFYGNDTRIIKNRVGAYSHGSNGFENSQPLKMAHVYAAGAMQSTVEDLFKWHQAIHSYILVKKETLDKAFTGYKLTDGTETAYGYGWRLGYVYESPSIWHGGLINGFATVEMFLPKEDVFVTIFSNCDCHSPVDMASRLAALTIGQSYEYKELLLKNNILQEYTGVYENQKSQKRIITLSGNKLFSQLGRGPKFNVKAYQTDRFYFDDDALFTIQFSRNGKGDIDKLTTWKITGNEVWMKTNTSIPDSNGIKVDRQILETYVGEYEITPDFVFSVTKEQDKIFLQAPEQDRVEMFADTENKFFLKVNDAQLEFVQDDSGRIIKAILNQGGRQADAKKIK